VTARAAFLSEKTLDTDTQNAQGEKQGGRALLFGTSFPVAQRMFFLNLGLAPACIAMIMGEVL